MSFRFLFGTMLCLVLIAVSTVVSLHDYQSRMDDYDSAMAEGNKSDGESVSFRIPVYRKPEPLSIFVRGFDKRFGNVVTMSFVDSSVPIQAGGAMGTSESAQFFAEFASIDFLFVVKVVLSLLAIFLSYDTISGEYERGTLKLALSRPVSRVSIILGKLIAGAVCLLIPLIMSFIIGILIVQLTGGVNFTSEDWLRISLIAGAAILCVMSFFMIGLVVSSRTRQAATSLLILLLIWITGVFLIPGIATTIAGRHRLMASDPGKDISAISNDFYKRKRADTMPDYSDWDARTKYMLKWEERADEKNQSVWNLQRQYLDGLYSQADLVRWICRLSPSESCGYAAEAMARTDTAAYRSFMRYVRAYHEPHKEYAKYQWKEWHKFKAYREQYNEVAQIPSVRLSASFRAAAPDICLLIIYNALFFMLSVLFFAKYDVH